MSLHIGIILGSARADRESEKVAHYLYAQAQKTDWEPERIDVRDYATSRTIPPWEENEIQKKWASKASECDGFILVIPEYNHGYPGELKLLLDMAFTDEYGKKPVGIAAVSSGHLGGARVIEHILPILVNFSMVISKNHLYFSNVNELFAQDGTIQDEAYHKRVATLFADIDWYGTILQSARNSA